MTVVQVRERLAGMQEAMKRPEVQKQVAEMQSAMQNQQLQARNGRAEGTHSLVQANAGSSCSSVSLAEHTLHVPCFSKSWFATVRQCVSVKGIRLFPICVEAQYVVQSVTCTHI